MTISPQYATLIAPYQTTLDCVVTPLPKGEGTQSGNFWERRGCQVCVPHTHLRVQSPLPWGCEACPKGEGGYRGDGAPEYHSSLADNYPLQHLLALGQIQHQYLGQETGIDVAAVLLDGGFQMTDHAFCRWQFNRACQELNFICPVEIG